MTVGRLPACARAPKRCRPCCRRSPRVEKLEWEMSMRRSQRLTAAAVLIALTAALGGCSSSMGNWDPTDLLDFLDTKKKLPGERKPVFPEGVPGLEQGVPKELYKGASQQQDPAAAAAVQPVEQPKSQKAKSKAKAKQVATAPAQGAAPAPEGEAAPEEEGSTAAAPPAPKAKKIVRRRTTAPPPDSAPQAARPAAQPQQAGSAFPAPLPSGTFQR